MLTDEQIAKLWRKREGGIEFARSIERKTLTDAAWEACKRSVELQERDGDHWDETAKWLGSLAKEIPR